MLFLFYGVLSGEYFKEVEWMSLLNTQTVRANLPLVCSAPHYPFTWPSFSPSLSLSLCYAHPSPCSLALFSPSFSLFVLCNHQLCVWQQTQTNPQAPAQLSVARGTRVFPPPPIPPTPPTHCDLQPNPPARTHTHQTLRPVAAIHSLAIETLQWSSVAECTQTSDFLDPDPDSLLKSLKEKQELTSSPGGCVSVSVLRPWEAHCVCRGSVGGGVEGLVIYNVLPCVIFFFWGGMPRLIRGFLWRVRVRRARCWWLVLTLDTTVCPADPNRCQAQIQAETGYINIGRLVVCLFRAFEMSTVSA